MNVLPGEGLRDRLKLEIMYDLGYPVVKIEVIEPWIDSAIDRAFAEFSRWTPQSEEWTTFTSQPGNSRYQVPADYLFIRNVVYTPRLNSAFIQTWTGNWGGWYDWVSIISLTDYVITEMYLEMSERTFGLQGTWEFHHPFLYIYPTPREAVPVFVKYVRYVDESLDDIRQEGWVRDYALAVIKIRLGRARSKYQSLPGPRGDVSMDGDALLNEGHEALRRLVDELRQEHEEPLGFYTG